MFGKALGSAFRRQSYQEAEGASKALQARLMQQAEQGQAQAVQETLAHGSDRRIAQFDNKAFAQNEQETDRKYDAQSQYEAAKKMWSDGGDVAADGSKIYRGQMAYRQYTSKSESFDSQVLSGAGPARARPRRPPTPAPTPLPTPSSYRARAANSAIPPRCCQATISRPASSHQRRRSSGSRKRRVMMRPTTR